MRNIVKRYIYCSETTNASKWMMFCPELIGPLVGVISLEINMKTAEKLFLHQFLSQNRHSGEFSLVFMSAVLCTHCL